MKYIGLVSIIAITLALGAVCIAAGYVAEWRGDVR